MIRHIGPLAVAALLCSCSASEVTQIMVVVDSDIPVPADLDSMRIDVVGLGMGPMRSTGDLTGASGLPLPRSLALVHDGGPLGPIEITATGFLGGSTVVVERRAEVFFVENRIMVLRLDLLASCVGTTCGAGMTCGESGCRPTTVGPGELEEWTGVIPGRDAGVPGDDSGMDDSGMLDGCVSSTEVCNSMDDDCDMSVDEDFDLTTDTLNCGSCGTVCSAPMNATAACAASTCGFSCRTGFDDCNMSAADGCEADLSLDATCGSCGVACTAREACVGLTCISVAAVAEIDGGDLHTCARLASGSVACWGSNADSQLGDGGGGDRNSPFVLPSITDAASIATGAAHTCVVLAGGSVQCWGKNDRGQAGGAAGGADVSAPRTVASLTDATRVTCGATHTCVLRAGGAVSCWGRNDRGQLGFVSGDTGTPRLVALPSPALRIAAGAEHTCALLDTDVIVCWGRNDRGQLGTGGGGGTALQTVPMLTSPTELEAGGRHTCALLASGVVSCWGDNALGQLGTSEGGNRDTPMNVTGLTDAIGLTTGYDHTCVIRSGDSVACFGENADGQLGNGGFAPSSSPLGVTLGPAFGLGAGDAHSCALLRDGTAACWGHGMLGQLGDGTGMDRATPVAVVGIP